ncbi:hypothetical protein [Bremerella sp.]|uniref:hypothetical protein n=1 Tax=Bremerella sp. TaxID=2795602 RepID=UPI00391CC495
MQTVATWTQARHAKSLRSPWNALIMPATGMIAEHVGWLQPNKSECHLPSLVRQADNTMAVRQRW